MRRLGQKKALGRCPSLWGVLEVVPLHIAVIKHIRISWLANFLICFGVVVEHPWYPTIKSFHALVIGHFIFLREVAICHDIHQIGHIDGTALVV